MKQKKRFILFCTMIIIGLCGTYCLDAGATAKPEMKKRVYKSITGVKSGKYTYYNDGTAIFRENSKGKRTKLSKYKADGEFILNGDYIYYHSESEAKIYRMTKNGKSQKKYNVSASKIRMIKGGYIYYNNALGLNRISISGKTGTKKKLLGYSNNFQSTIIGNRIYYKTYKRKENGDTKSYTYYIRSVNLKGEDKRTHATFERTENVKISSDACYLFISAEQENGWELGAIDTKASKAAYQKLQYNKKISDDTEEPSDVVRYEPLAVINGRLYYQNREELCCMNVKGEVEQLLVMPTQNIQGVHLEKQGDYFWLLFYGDDSFGENYIYNKDWELVKKITRKYGDVTNLRVKNKKVYVVFNQTEDASPIEKYMTYKIYNIR